MNMNFFLIKIKILPALFIFSIGPDNYAQPNSFIQNIYTSNSFYPDTKENNSIQKVDSIAHTTGAANYFAGMYGKIMESIERKIEHRTEPEKLFIRKFELSFADYFLKAYYDEKDCFLSPFSEWKCLFSHPNIQSWQLLLLGVNAHVNIDMWQALVASFSEEEIMRNKRQFLSVQPAIAKVYRPFFDEIMNQSSYLKFINSFTGGVAKITGERLVYKWRKRNVRLAVLFYKNPEKFKRRAEIIRKKKQKIDEIILSR